MKVERIELDGRDGPPRPAWSVAPEGDPRAGAAIFHGYGSSRDALLGLALTLAGGGFACVLPDLPGHGEHPELLGPVLLDDARRAVEHARRHGAVLAVGHSLGGRLALLSEADAVVAISPALPAQASPEGMYALQTFATPRVRQAYPGEVMDILRGLPPHAVSGSPVLLVIGEGDIPSIVEAVEELAASLDSARVVKISRGMLLEVDDPPPSFLSYIKHWVNHGGLHGNPDVKATVAAWADEVAGNVRVEGR
ncbi:MAG TPA: alpha/beta fold hydrolase [Actinomycetota bacterium]|nr:alpha/beta fold hydrolase [Actinomycetota bacterium]